MSTSSFTSYNEKIEETQVTEESERITNSDKEDSYGINSSTSSMAQNQDHSLLEDNEINNQCLDCNTTVDSEKFCEMCVKIGLERMEVQLPANVDDMAQYRDYPEESVDDVTDEQMDKLIEELAQMREQEAQLCQELDAGGKKSADLESQVEKKKKELKMLKQELNKTQLSNEHKNFLENTIEICVTSLDDKIKVIKNQTERMSKTNIFATTFHINRQDGTINGLRLSKNTSCLVEWDEINAAWGQAVLLLHSLAKRMGLEFKRYLPVVYGNYSRMESLKSQNIYPLFYKGVHAYLICLEQFKMATEGQLHRIKNTTSPLASFTHKDIKSLDVMVQAVDYILATLQQGLDWVESC